jgi:nucleoside-diphosphate kinase
MALEKTLTIIKPDAVASQFTGKILALIEDNGLRIIGAKMLHLSSEMADVLYQEHKARSFYPSLQEYMTSGPVLVAILDGEDAVAVLREIMGATVPKDAAIGTIRNLYAEHEFTASVLENAIHGSDSAESAQREIDFFFKPDEIYTRTR